MKSLQARMLAALAAIVLLSWSTSLWILVALVTQGHHSVFEQELNLLGDQLLATCPTRSSTASIRRQSRPTRQPRRPRSATHPRA